MPQLNWQALKSNQLEGTVFKELDDEHVLEVTPHHPCLLLLLFWSDPGMYEVLTSLCSCPIYSS